MAGIHLYPGETRVDRLVQAIRQLQQGRDDNSGVVTLTPSVGTTTVSAPNVSSSSSNIFLTAKTANAAAEFKNGTIWISAVANGSFTITHANNAQADRSFFWCARG